MQGKGRCPLLIFMTSSFHTNGYVGAALFDLDSTLWDHNRAQHGAIKKICMDHGINFPTFYPLYHRHNLEVWQALARGEMQIQDVRIARFARTLDALQLQNLSPANLNDEYMRNYATGVYLMDGTVNLLQSLRPHYILGIVTNGTFDVQWNKVSHSPLKDFMDFMITIDDAGCSKPDREIFQHAFERSGFPAEMATFIGDSYYDDIIGATLAGAGRTIWFNPDRIPIPNTFDIRPTHEIRHLNELIPILLKESKKQ